MLSRHVLVSLVSRELWLLSDQQHQWHNACLKHRRTAGTSKVTVRFPNMYARIRGEHTRCNTQLEAGGMQFMGL